MSADNWAVCPQCRKTMGDDVELPNTLREDYEIYMDEDFCFTVSYGCSCSVCKFEYSHKTVINVEAK